MRGNDRAEGGQVVSHSIAETGAGMRDCCCCSARTFSGVLLQHINTVVI